MRDPVNGRGVLDTNQASCLPEANLFTGVNQFRKRLTLPPLVLAEILLRANPEPTLRRLRGYDVRLGIDLRQAFDLLSRVSTKFRPFAPDDIDLSRFVTSALENPTDRHRNWARDQKAANRVLSRNDAEKYRECTSSGTTRGRANSTIYDA